MSSYIQKVPSLHDGKANTVYGVYQHPELLILERRDDVSAGDGARRGKILGKGVCNNYISNCMFELLEKRGIDTHYVEVFADRSTVVKRAEPIKLEVTIRNIATGSFCREFPMMEKNKVLETPIYELHYKDDSLEDPLINETRAIALDVATKDELDAIEKITYSVNDVLSEFFKKIGIILVDFKIEFGRLSDGHLVVIDEISPDTCRLWDQETKRKLDKDTFRQELGGEEEAYREIYERVKAYFAKDGETVAK